MHNVQPFISVEVNSAFVRRFFRLAGYQLAKMALFLKALCKHVDSTLSIRDLI